MACRLLVLSLLCALVGCGESINVEKVTGTVKLDGQPIKGASITFSPVEGGTGMPAVGTSDADGAFSITDMRGGEFGGGAAKGEYKIGVLWYAPSSTATADASGDSAGDSEAQVADKKSHNQTTGPKSNLPAAYQNPEKSGLTTTVTDGENVVNLDLDSKFTGK